MAANGQARETDREVVNLILCGGVGSRLWPLSRKLLPKQFARILQGQTLFERTVKRNRQVASSVMIAANRHQAFLAFNQMENLGIHEHFGLIEPVGRNTAPAIALAAMLVDPETILLVTPSDHLISLEEAYADAVRTAVELADAGRIVTFGIEPAYAETGFGYIEADSSADDPYAVKGFREKPDAATAAAYIEAGNYYWNSGMFCFRAEVFLNELKHHAHDVYETAFNAFNNANGLDARKRREPWQPMVEAMHAIPAISVDYAVMEKSDRIAVVPCDIGWSDLGSLDALYEYYMDQDGSGAEAAGAEAENRRSAGGKDAQANVGAADTEPVFVDAKRNLVIGDQRQVALIDVDDLMVVETQDALLIARRGSGQKVKQVVEALQERSGPERRLTERFPTVERPWGKYSTLHVGDRYMVRRLEIKPGCRTSLQRHHKREEHWTVVAGQALVQIEKSRKHFYPGQGVEIPMGAFHRLENPGADLLVIVETQMAAAPVETGAREAVPRSELPELDEADVERAEDDYRWLR
jgi:mannose-1-phosphate guanylyltransferase